MVVSISGYLFLFVGLLILALPLMLVELSRPRDWLMGGLFLFLGLFLLVENDLLKGSINLLVISMAILYGKMILEIIQNRWYQLSSEEKKRIGSFKRWFESFKQLGQSFALMGNGFLNLFKGFTTKSEKPLKEKKWVHPELQEEVKKKVVDRSGSIDSNKLRNKEFSENEETS
ncbi:hypothetical protein [Prochlorococcus marinus]|uniref:hypothetical protein n=1 Tax=Prochlorococcus marinus TaxID=1219 RepID=UPI0022B57F43|nr:hypothetical protein [Prochlorococcus marinus]